jgi:hypothetical protein
MLKKIAPVTTDNTRPRAVQLITDEERKLFSTMNILIAEGKIYYKFIHVIIINVIFRQSGRTETTA